MEMLGTRLGSKAAQFPDHLGRPPVRALFRDGWTAFLVRDALAQNLPHETTEPMCVRADGLDVSQTDHEPAIHELEDTALGLDRRVRRLIEDAAHLTIAMRGPTAVIDAGALAVAGHAPIQDARCFAEGNVAAAGPSVRRIGCQYRSSVSHTGRQYCAVDSITASSTSRSTSQSARRA